ncbi:NAD(+)/NADH kinase [Faecalicoccus acidiformans]|uniref:NAD kinase n=1 Tax=Faecalicoccus acidiformans TaxID=915173 RepID=A0ABS2FNW5_9FIRM|nr:NAD(+)/NADH kinase [Faecalicoccus acidiformans]MBM6831723.1 NAD(+)/NADH kinase [Faecalicoccus acidiformans]
MRFGLIVRNDSHSDSVARYIKEQCLRIGWIYDDAAPELLISIGGDGTLLRGIHHYIDHLNRISVVGIHTGTLGFYTDYTQEEVDTFIHDIQFHEVQYEEMPLLEMQIDDSSDRLYALNEMRIESLSRTLSLDVSIDGECFEHCTGSGICISTQAGSTAINRALQGAVIDDGLRVLQLCEIMPISHKNHHSLRNPYIMRLDRRIEVQSDSFISARVCYDHLDRSLDQAKHLLIQTSQKKVRFARYRQYSYLKRLKNLY